MGWWWRFWSAGLRWRCRMSDEPERLYGYCEGCGVGPIGMYDGAQQIDGDWWCAECAPEEGE